LGPDDLGLLEGGSGPDAGGPTSAVGVLVPAGAAGRAAPPSTSPDSTAAAAAGSRGDAKGGDRAASGVLAAPAQQGVAADTGVAFGPIAMWGAVGLGGLFFSLALVQLMLRRRRRRRLRRDGRYLAGLSRLSALGQISDRT
jgi:hypothetical protein